MNKADFTKEAKYTKDVIIPESEADELARLLTNKDYKPAKGPSSWSKPVKIFPVKFADGKYGKVVIREDSSKGYCVDTYLEDSNHIVIASILNRNTLATKWILKDVKTGVIYLIRILKRKDKTYAVKVDWTLSKTYEVKATSSKEAEKKIQALIDAGEVNVYTDGFETTDDVEAKCVGEEGKDGMIEYL